MANSNSLVDALRIAGLASETAAVLTNPGGNNPWLFTAPATPVANAGAPIVLALPVVQGEGPQAAERLDGGNQSTDQVWYADRNTFVVRAVGRVQPNATGKTLKLYLFAGNGLPSGAPGAVQDLQVAFGSATVTPTIGGAFTNWYLEAKCLWDSSSLQLTGVYSGNIGGTAIAATGFQVYNPSAWVAQQAPGSYNPLSFVVGANVNSTANANPDLVYLDEFSADEY